MGWMLDNDRIAQCRGDWRRPMSQATPDEEKAPKVRRPYGPSQQTRLDQQIKIIQDAFAPDHVVKVGFSEKTAQPDVGPPEDEPQYLYVEGRILIRDQDLSRLEALRDAPPPNSGPPITGGVANSLINGVSVWEFADGRTTMDVLAQLDRLLGIGVAAPDHVLFVTRGNAGCCPATEPETGGRNNAAISWGIPRLGRRQWNAGGCCRHRVDSGRRQASAYTVAQGCHQ